MTSAMTSPTIVLVGADKGGVGKTMASRVMLDYLARRGSKVRAFDTEWPKGNLKRFEPAADVVDIAKVADQMRIFDGVTDDVVTLVDIRAGLLSPTIKALDDARLLDDVRAGVMGLVLVHVLGETVASIGEITQAAEAIGKGARHFLVKNKTNAEQTFDWESLDAKAALAGMADVTITIEPLPQIAAKETDDKGGSFADFNIHSPSRTLRGLVGKWLDKVEAEFDRVRLLG